jgi:ABC-type nitrate/sulfonate/bicarbonate transport system substrate-binding protein
MRNKLYLGLTFCLLLIASSTFGQQRMTYAVTSLTPTHAGLLTALDLELFKKEGIDVTQNVITGSAAMMPALLSGDIDIAVGISGEATVRAYRQGAKNLRIIATEVPRFTFSLVTKPEIDKLEKLKGKVLGVTRFGGSLDASLRLILARAGLNNTRDRIVLVQLTRLPDLYMGLISGRIDGGMLTSTFTQDAKRKGYNELVDLGVGDLTYPQAVIVTKDELIKSKPDLVARFLRAYLLGLKEFITKKDLGMKVIEKYTKVSDKQALATDYEDFSKKYLSKDGVTSKDYFQVVFQQLQVPENERAEILATLIDNSMLKSAER